MLNHCAITGRMVRDPELRQTPGGVNVCSFSIACDRDYKAEGQERETDFIDVTVWRGTAEFVSKYFGKGDLITVAGRLQIRRWTDNDGNNRRSAEIAAENVYFGGSKRKEADGGLPGSSAPTHTDEDAPPELPPAAQAFAQQWGVSVEDGETF